MHLDPRETLESMMGLLGFFCQVEESWAGSTLVLQIYTAEKDRLIGRDGELIDDLQTLLNRMLAAQDKNAPKVQVDVEHFRAMQEDRLVAKVRQLADLVRVTGRPVQLDPMNAYERRIVHNAFEGDPDVKTWSPPENARIKRITLRRR